MLCERNRCAVEEKLWRQREKLLLLASYGFILCSVLHAANCNISIFNIMICKLAERMQDLRQNNFISPTCAVSVYLYSFTESVQGII